MIVVVLVFAGCSQAIVEQGPSNRYRTELSQDCSEDYIVVFARGSSQPQDISGQPETRRFFQVIDEVFRRDVKIGYVSVDYPAMGGLSTNVEAYQKGAAAGVYHDSRLAGSEAAAELLNERTARCDDVEAGDEAGMRQRYILGGYSQGAHAMREALFLLDEGTAERVSYVALFGDPTFRDSEIAAGTYEEDAEGIFGGAAAQVPDTLVGASQSYCDRQDFVCSAGKGLSGLLAGELENQLRRAVGQESAHALYPFGEMYAAAAEYLARRQLPGLFDGLPKVDIEAGQFVGQYEGTAGCEWSGRVGYSEAGLLLYLILDIYSDGTELTDTETIDHLTGVLTYEDTSMPERNRLGQAFLKGSASEGSIDLRHVRWISGGDGLTPINIGGEATYVLLDDGPIAESDRNGFIQTPLSGHEGCGYMLNKVRPPAGG